MTLKYFPYFFWQLPSLWTRSESWTLFASWQIPPRLAFPARKHSLRDWESSSRIISWWKKKRFGQQNLLPPPSLAKLICHTIVSETYPRQGWIRVPVVKVTQTFVLCSLKFRKSIKMFWIQTFSFLSVPDSRVYYMLQVWCACLLVGPSSANNLQLKKRVVEKITDFPPSTPHDSAASPPRADRCFTTIS